MEHALSLVHRSIEHERKVNNFLLKGSIVEKPMANIKRYHALRIFYVRQEKKDVDKLFTREEFKKFFVANDVQKRTLNTLGAVNDPGISKKDMQGFGGDMDEKGGAGGDAMDKSATSGLKMKDNQGDGVARDDEVGASFIARMEGSPDKKNKLNLKLVIQNIFKNIKNIFTNDELNIPNQTLFRAVVIKRLMNILLLLFMSAATGYLVYITILQQYTTYNFKLTSIFAITRYQNVTISLINEYMMRSLYCNDDPLNGSTFCRDVESRIGSFRNIMGAQDIDNNVRNDFFFSSLGQTNVSFILDYPNLDPRNATSSKYTITIMLLEKLLAYDISDQNEGDAQVFLDDNFLPIVNQYFTDSKQAAQEAAQSILASNQVD
jgi:hypothetical protein